MINSNLSKFKLFNFLLLNAGLLCTNLYADITVVGIGTQEVSPNIASFTVNIESRAKTATQASANNASQTDKTVKLLKSLLSNPKAVTTQGYSINPEYQYNRTTNKSEFIGFVANNSILVTTNDIKQVGDLLDKTINSGVSRVDNLVFTYDKPEQVYQQALASAIANAKQRAEVLAKASDLKLKKIGDIKVTSFDYSPPRPMMARMAVAESSVSTPIEAADIKTKAMVEVVFESD
jgi:uncharacterized protein YggE